MARLPRLLNAARANFAQPDIFKQEGLRYIMPGFGSLVPNAELPNICTTED